MLRNKSYIYMNWLGLLSLFSTDQIKSEIMMGKKEQVKYFG